jgi:hypothetical protein
VDVGRIQRGERIAMYGGAFLAIAIFLPWYHLGVEGSGATVSRAKLADNIGPDTVSGWSAHHILRFLLLLAALAPFILAYIIAQDYALSWPRGEMTAVVAITALGLIGYQAFIDRPGNPRGLIGLRYGIILALLATILMLVGAATRSSEVERARKPPGTI